VQQCPGCVDSALHRVANGKAQAGVHRAGGLGYSGRPHVMFRDAGTGTHALDEQESLRQGCLTGWVGGWKSSLTSFLTGSAAAELLLEVNPPPAPLVTTSTNATDKLLQATPPTTPLPPG
jgi:hypothetical protein